MYVQVVTYGLAGIHESEYLDVANDVAPRFAGMSGLLSKLWLGNTEEGRYGAVYFWEDRESMERFLRSDLFEAFNPEFADVSVEDFDVLENLTAVTQPVLQILEPKRQPPGRTPLPTAARTAIERPGASSARKAPVTRKAATKAAKKTAKQTVTAAKHAGPAAKGVGAARKSATRATKKTAKATAKKAR